jgi:hypothetical protein
MFIKQIIITGIVSLVITFSAFAKENKSSKAEIMTMLFNAVKFTEKASIKSTNPTFGKKQKKGKVIFYRMTSPTGGLMEKYELFIKNKKSIIVLRNKKAFISMENSNIAIETNVPIIPAISRSGYFLKVLKYYKQFKIGTYSLSPDKYKDIPCYKVTVKFPTDDATIAKIENATLEYLKKNRDYCENRYISVMTFLIGKKEPFIYSSVCYSMRGKVALTTNWGDVDFKAPITQKDFEFSKGTSIKVAKTRAEVRTFAKKYFK